MKLLIKYTVLLSACVALLFASSCQTTCDTGYEGKRCDVPWRDKFKGVWSATDVSGDTTLSYQVTISDGNEVVDVYISRDFSQNRFLKFVRATINDNIITIVNQKPDASKNIYVDGTGTLSSDKSTINWIYKLTDKSAFPETVTIFTCVWVKQ